MTDLESLQFAREMGYTGAGLAAHVPGVAAIESNSRQYVANKPWEDRFPAIFRVKDGYMDTSVLNKPGLSAVGCRRAPARRQWPTRRPGEPRI